MIKLSLTLDQSLTRVKNIGTLQSRFMYTWLLMGCVASAGRPGIRGGGGQCQLPAAGTGASPCRSGVAWEEAGFPHSTPRAWWACLHAGLGVSGRCQLGLVEVCSLGALPAWQTRDGGAWGHLSLSWLAPAPGSLRMHAHGHEVHLYAVHSGYITVGSGGGTHVFFSCRLWALSPNAADSNGDSLCHFSPLLLPAALSFPSFSNGGKAVSA